MARVYTSRQLIDPNLASYMEQVIQNRVANEANRNKELLSSTRNMLSPIGKTVDDYIGRFQREKELQNAEANKDSVSYIDDPTYRAAREEYIRTGSSQPITSYMLQKEAAEARKLEAQKREDAANTEKDRNAAIRLENDRTDYLKAQKNMMDSMAAGDYATAEIYKSQMNAIEKRYEPGTFGSSSDALYNARKKAIEEAAAKKEAEELEKQAAEADAKTLELANKAKEQYSFNTRMNVENNVLPNAKNIDDKTNYKKLVKQLYDNGKLTEDDAKLLLNKIDSTETIGEKTKKSVEGTIASKEGEKTGKNIDENRNKADAKQYVGKKLNSLEWNKIPAEQKKYLNRDAQGVVTEK